MSRTSTLALRLFGYIYGILALSVWSTLAVWRMLIRLQEPKPDNKDIAEAQDKLWSLENETSHKGASGHHFLSVREGVQLHYISSLGRTRSANLILFLHGFPDSCHVFTHFLAFPLADHATVVSLDFPGFGGSDGLPNYGADEVLNTLARAVVMLKQRHLVHDKDGDSGQCILVGHDWGSVVASRLAMETQGLIDRVVIMNGVVPKVVAQNVRAGVIACGSHLQEWWRDKSGTQTLQNAREAMRPIFAQLLASNYIFVFRLPFFNSRRFGFVMEHLISLCHHHAAAERPPASGGSRSWASAIGPSVHECQPSGSGPAYGDSVRERAAIYPRGDWDTRLRLYSEDLFSGSWTLRDTSAEEDVRQVAESERAIFQCAATIIFGTKDFALDHRVCVDNIEQFFRPKASGKPSDENHVFRMRQCGHWSPLEETGIDTLRDLLLHVMGVDIGNSTIATGLQTESVLRKRHQMMVL